MSEQCGTKQTDLHGAYIPYAEALRLRWRIGTQVKRTIYATKLLANGNRVDRLVGMMDTPELAERTVWTHNQAVDALANLTDASWPAAFRLNRHTDVSNVSGTGVVADGYYWPKSEIAIIRWHGEWPSWNLHLRGIEAVQAVHGHSGLTAVEFTDTPALAVPDAVLEMFTAAVRVKALSAD